MVDQTVKLPLSDLAKLGDLLEKHRPQLLAFLRQRIDRRLAVRIDPEEILSELYIAAQRKWATFKAQAPYAWLLWVARDCLLEAWRRETRGCRDLQCELPWSEDSSLQLGLSLREPPTTPYTALDRKDLEERMHDMLKLLKDTDREILQLRQMQKMSYEEIAVVLDVNANAAAVRYYRALERVTKRWQELYPDDWEG